MKKFLLILSYLASLGLWNVASAAPVIEVTLLGTGVPLTNAAALNAAGRALSGLMVKAGTEKMLFDCGQGIFTRLIQSGGSMMTPNVGVDKVFLSHLHSDHIGDLGALYAVGALYRKVDATGSDPSTLPLRVWGPEGGPNQPVATWALMQNFRIAYETDFFVRLRFTGPGDATITPESVETINSTTELFEGVVYSNDGVTVTAFLVDHKPVEPAYGFRVDYLGHSIVYSGDTTFSQNLINHSINVDILVHEVYGFARADGPLIFDFHTSPEQAAQIFLATQPKQAIYTHLVIPPGTTPRDLVNRTRAAGYHGPLRSGRDFMRIIVNDDSTISITAPPKTANLDTKKATSSFIEVGQPVFAP